MGVFHNIFGDHDAEIAIVEKVQKATSETVTALSGSVMDVTDKVTALSSNVTGLSNTVTNVSSSVTDLSSKFTALSGQFKEFSSLPVPEALVTAPTEFSAQALQAAETVVDPDKMMLICTVVSAAAVLIMASFIGFCIYQAIKHERGEKQNLPPETDINSSRTSSFSNLTLETQV